MVSPQSRTSEETVVIIDASAETAHEARELSCRTVFVQLPGSPVDRIVGDSSGYYSVDFSAPSFSEFVKTVLVPLAPSSVISRTAKGQAAASVAHAVLDACRNGEQSRKERK